MQQGPVAHSIEGDRETVERQYEPEKRAGDRPRHKGALMDSEKCGSDVQQHRECYNDQPSPARHHRAIEGPERGVEQNPCKKREVDRRASHAHGQRSVQQMKGTLIDLMTHRSEEFVEYGTR